jgi:mRNA export factor
MVIGTAERHVLIYNLNNPSTAFKTLQSSLKWQTRVITCFPDASGYAVGSIEGRIAIEYVEDKDQRYLLIDIVVNSRFDVIG